MSAIGHCALCGEQMARHHHIAMHKNDGPQRTWHQPHWLEHIATCSEMSAERKRVNIYMGRHWKERVWCRETERDWTPQGRVKVEGVLKERELQTRRMWSLTKAYGKRVDAALERRSAEGLMTQTE